MSQLGRPKTTTGCKTCKSRRVKCDEQKPSCARCIKAGRECLGYEPWQDLSPSRRSQSPRDLASPRKTDAEQELYFRVFVEDGSKQSVARSDVQFWSTLVPQLSEAEPAIRYATVAIGALMLQLRPRQTPSDHILPERQALTYYNKSIQALLSGSQPVNTEIVLLSNVLFTCIECMQGHDAEALTLFHKGRRMFEQYLAASPKHDSASPITDSVRKFLTRLRVLALLYGPAMPDYHSPITRQEPEQAETLFETFEEARSVLFFLTGEVHEVIRKASGAKLAHKSQFNIISDLERQQASLRSKMHEWKTRFWPLIEPALYPPQHTLDRIAVLTLQCHYIIISVWLACCLAVDECSYDIYLPCFRRIVEIAESVVALLAENDIHEQPFSMEIGIIAPLYMTVRKCRDPALRRTAIDLLRRGRRQEGLWEAKQCVEIAERLVEIEESRRLEGESWPGGEARLQAMLLYPRSTTPDGYRGNIVHFFVNPSKPGEEWESWEEWFPA